MFLLNISHRSVYLDNYKQRFTKIQSVKVKKVKIQSEHIFLINTQNQIKVKIIQKMKTQKLQFASTSLHNLQKNKLVMISIKKTSNSDNKSKHKNTNVDI